MSATANPYDAGQVVIAIGSWPRAVFDAALGDGEWPGDCAKLREHALLVPRQAPLVVAASAFRMNGMDREYNEYRSVTGCDAADEQAALLWMLDGRTIPRALSIVRERRALKTWFLRFGGMRTPEFAQLVAGRYAFHKHREQNAGSARLLDADTAIAGSA